MTPPRQRRCRHPQLPLKDRRRRGRSGLPPTPSDTRRPAESVRVTDRPAGQVTPENRAHLIESGLTTRGELDALVADYLGRAEQLQAVPAAATPVDIALAELIAK